MPVTWLDAGTDPFRSSFPLPSGPTMDPKVASELSLRIPHLALRVREHSARALSYAGEPQRRLAGHGPCTWQGRMGWAVWGTGHPVHRTDLLPPHLSFKQNARPGLSCQPLQSGCKRWEPRWCTPASSPTHSMRCCSGWPTQVRASGSLM